MTWEIRLVKWKQKRAKKIEKKKLRRRQRKDLKDVMRQLYEEIKLSPANNSYFIYCSFLETAKKLRDKGFNVEFITESESDCCYWYEVSWKE